MSDKIVSCPVDGCSYEGPKGSVQAHYSSKTDGLHPGGINKITELLVSDSEPADPDPDIQPDKQPESTTESTGSNPTFGSAEPRPEPEPDSQPSEQPSRETEDDSPDGEYVCLECGGEVYDFSGYESGKMYDVNGNSIMVAGDYQCSQCGEWFIDE